MEPGLAAYLSLGALLLVIAASCFAAVHPGVLAIACAWLIGVFVPAAADKPLGIRAVMAGFPVDLFVTLTGVTLLFAQAHVNGTLEKAARAAVNCCRGNAGLIPAAFFLLAAALASIGAGNIAAAALIGPPAMAAARRGGIPPLLMAVMVAHGSVAGALSPVSPTGLVANRLLAGMGLGGHEWRTYLYNFGANAFVAAVGFLLFGGPALLRAGPASDRADNDADGRPPEPPAAPTDAAAPPSEPFGFRHGLTLAVIGAMVVGAIGFRIDLGPAAMAGAVLLVLTGAADHERAVRHVPWGVILMVCGVTVLTSMLEKTGGNALFTSMISAVSTPATITFVMALVVGAISVYSSTVGVVLPAFLPMVPGIVAKVDGADALAVASSINVGGHLVDVSPLSTIGALCIAGADVDEAERRILFNRMLLWGLSMTVVGAAYCWVFFGLL
jgi:di/tricarboxylate transporter